ncbi:serine/threonine protein kinase [Streptomyces aurantiacus]|uniref:serine/threonine-protein kinase n=1 Tax=Streptomyces aurantiacus TaxID=47760 RepID=UPI002793964A|nr:serine/threonine-protein kinase [Streptomyces aurantiacus]MDQ0779640.1 serine/threonine protein kinase [Streptomyces aurantiacus]
MHHQDTGSPDESPERLVADRYRLLSTLGEGGMGTVWRARDEVLRREVAIKEVRAPSGLSADKIQRMYTRLEREAWAAARIAAPSVITVHDVVTDGGRPWIVMELVRGRSLADLLGTQGALSPQEAARIGAEVLGALRAAHDAEVLHRDVKPANVLLADDDRVILTDFGIAMVLGDTALTMTGEVVGSPEYLAPEQALGRPLGPATDLWSLGVLLYTAVQGRSPFRQDSALGTLRAVVDDAPPLPHRAGPLAAVIDGLLRKDPAERATAEQTARDLRLIAAGGTPDADSTETGTAPTTTVSAQTGDEHPSARPPSLGTTATDIRGTDIRAADITATDITATDVRATEITSTPTVPVRTSSDTSVTATGGTLPVSSQSPAPDMTVPDIAGTPALPASAPARPATPPAPPQVPPASSLPTVSAPPVTAGTPASPQPRRSRRTRNMLVALATVSVLLLGGLGYALTRTGDDDGADAKNPAAGTSSPAPQAQNESGAGEPPPVTVSVTGTNTTYAGSCPPEQGQAPAFTATFEVTELPVRFTYRWVSAEGSVVDRAWRALSFSEGGPRTHQETIRVTTYAQGGTLSSAMGVEIKSSQQTISDTVPFTLTCE